MSSHDPQPSITIVVPFFNRQAEVVRCIEAVKQQVMPEGVSFEIVAVDNNSSDGTGEVIAGNGVRVVHCERRGPAAARNAGIAAARGSIVAMTDSDCVPRPTWLRQLMEPFSDPAVLAAGGRIMALHVGSGPAFFAEDFQVLSQEKFFRGGVLGFPPFLATANVAYRKEALSAIGGFDEDLRIGEDSDLTWRLLELGGKIAYVPGAVVRHGHRETFRGLFEQAVDYGTGAAAVFAKHRRKMRRPLGVQWREIATLGLTPLLLPLRFLTGLNSYERKRGIYEAIWRTGFTIGRLSGSLRHRVIFL